MADKELGRDRLLDPFGTRDRPVALALGVELGERLKPQIVPGIILANKDDRGHPDFGFNVSRTGRIYHVTSLVPDVSRVVHKDDPTDTIILNEIRRLPSEPGFVPEAAFRVMQPMHALRVDFTLIPNGKSLQIDDPEIKPSVASIVGMLSIEKAANIITNARSPMLIAALELAPYLEEMYDDPERAARFSDFAFLRALRRNLMSITEEAAAQYCVENDLPVIYGQINPATENLEYTLSPRSDLVAKLPLAHQQTQAVCVVNERIIAAGLQEEPTPYTYAERSTITGELNDNRILYSDKASVDMNLIKTARRISHITTTELAEMPPDNFRQTFLDVFVKGLQVSGSAVRKIQNELKDRMFEGTALISDVSDVLFTLPNDEGEYDTLQEEAVQAMYTHQEYADKIFFQQRGRNKWQIKEHIITRGEGDNQQYDILIVANTGEEPEDQIVSDAFRTADGERGRSLARASILSKVIGIPPDINRELFEDAELDSVSVLDEQAIARMVPSKKTDQQDHPGGREREVQGASSVEKLENFCAENGYELLPTEFSFVPDRGKSPHHASISVKIGDFILSKEKFGTGTENAESQAAKKLLRQLLGPIDDTKPFPGEDEVDIGALSAVLGIPVAQMTMQYTTTSEGKRQANCIYFIEGNPTYTFVGRSANESEAQQHSLRNYKKTLQNFTSNE